MYVGLHLNLHALRRCVTRVNPVELRAGAAAGRAQVGVMAAPGYAAADLLAVAGMLGMGTIKTLLSKLMYGIQTRGIDGTVHSF
jgi:hypothetical protein